MRLLRRLLFRVAVLLLLALPFASGLTQTPAESPLAAPVLQSRGPYKLRAGDTIAVDYRLTPEFNQTLTIQPDGAVDLNLAGPTHLAGLTIEQAKSLVLARVSSRLRNPELNIALTAFERPYFVVAGEVDHPGRFDFYEKTTALQAILLAGGFKESAQQSDVYVFRRVDGDLAEVHTLNLKKVRHSQDLERDLVLEPGDMILVPRNRLENISRFIKATNLSIYFDPLEYAVH